MKDVSRGGLVADGLDLSVSPTGEGHVFGWRQNFALTVGANTGATVDEGGSDTITAAELDYNDGVGTDDDIVYTVTSAATNGTLLLGGVALATNGTFTQADINGGLVTYTHDGSETTGASFGFSVSDGVTSVTGQSFTFTVTPVDDASVVAPNMAPRPDSDPVVVNTTLTGNQTASTVATLSDGGYVVVWQSAGQDGSGNGIYGRRYDASGAPVGAEFHASTTTTDEQAAPAVAAFALGGFVVAWQGNGSGDASGIFVQRYNAAGVAVGGETLVNTATANLQFNPAVATLVGGGFVVTWSSDPDGNNIADIHAQRFDAAGVAQGGEVVVNTTNSSGRFDPVVTGLAGGGYIIAWHRLADEGGDGDDGEVFWRIYNAAGTPVGAEVAMPAPGVNQNVPAIAARPDGGFVVAWQSGGETADIYARLFDAAGSPIGDAVQANRFTGDGQRNSAVAVAADGSFFVSWNGIGPSDDGDVAGQAFTAAGVRSGAEVRLTGPGASQSRSAVAALADGTFVIAYSGGNADLNIVAQHLGPIGLVVREQRSLSLAGRFDISDVDGSAGTITLTLAVDYGTIDVVVGSSGATIVSGDGTGTVVVSGTLAQLDALLSGFDDDISLIYRTVDEDTPPASATLSLTTDDAGGTASSSVTIAIQAINDAPVLDLDIGAGGNDAAAAWTEGDGPTAIAPLAVFTDDNTSYDGATVTADISANEGADDALTLLSVGDGPGQIRIDGSNVYYEGNLVGTFAGGTGGAPLVVTFNATACHCSIQTVIGSIAFDSGDNPGTAQRAVTITLVDGAGTGGGGTDTASAEVLIDVTPVDDAPSLSVTGPDIAPLGDETRVNVPSGSLVQLPSIAVLTGGGHVVVWQAGGQDGSGAGIYLQRFDANGDPLESADLLVNTTTAGNQANPVVVALEGGGFVVAWAGNGAGDTDGIFIQRYDASGVAVGGETLVNTDTDGGRSDPAVAALVGGGFVVTWSGPGEGEGGDAGNVYAQIYDASGAASGTQIDMAAASNTQRGPTVSGLPNGGFIAAWSDDGDDVFVRRFGPTGTPAGSEAQVTNHPDGAFNPAITVLEGGGYVVSWTGLGGGDDGAVFAQTFAANGTPVGNSILIDDGSNQTGAVVAALAGGGFAIAYYGLGPGDNRGVFAQRYDATGTPVGQIVLLNTTLAGVQSHPAIAGLPDGGLIAVWQSDGSAPGIYLQQFEQAIAATEQVPVDLKGMISLGDVDTTGDVTVTISATSGLVAIAVGSSGVDAVEDTPGVWTLTGTIAELTALFSPASDGTVTYTADSDDPPATDTLNVAIDDGTTLILGSETIVITPVNDAPEGLDGFLGVVEDETYTFCGCEFGYYDPEGDDFAGVVIATAPTAGQLLLNGVAVTDGQFITAADIQNGLLTYTPGADDNGLDYATLTFRVRDEFGAEDATDRELTIDVAPVNDAPTAIAAPVYAGSEDVPLALTGIVVGDVDSDPALDVVTVRLAVASGVLTLRDDVSGGLIAADIEDNGSGTILVRGTLDQINATLAAAGGLVYLGDAEFSGTDDLSIIVTDGVQCGCGGLSFVEALLAPIPATTLLFADLAGDGSTQLLGGGALADGGFILVLDTFGPGGLVPTAGIPTAFLVDDIDNDGLHDVVFTAGPSTLAAQGYLGAIDANGEELIIATFGEPAELAAADLDGDTLRDYVLLDLATREIAVLMRDDPDTFAAPTMIATGYDGLVALVVGDFDGDTVPDLIVAGTVTGNPSVASGITLYSGVGDGTFAAGVSVFQAGTQIADLLVADVNGDGIADIVYAAPNAAGTSAEIGVLLGSGGGVFAAAITTTVAADVRGVKLAAGDFNNDTFLDIALLSVDAADPEDEDGLLSILGGTGDGRFGPQEDFVTDPDTTALAAGDFDGDGSIDLMTGGLSSDLFFYYNLNTLRSTRIDVPINIVPVDDGPAPVADTNTTPEDQAASGNVLTNDTDIDGGPKLVIEVNGLSASVGQPITLASGALLTLNSDGSYSYDPNGRFNHLVSTTTAGLTGAVNSEATDSFTYTVTGGATETVTITITGVDNAGNELRGDGGGNTITGTSGGDIINLSQGGDDTASGGGGDDGFIFGAAYTSADVVDGGPGGLDQLGLRGDYSGGVTLGVITGIENVVLLSGSNTRFGGVSTDRFSYNITATDANVAAGQLLVVSANTLLAGENFTFNGAAELDGAFFLYGGLGTETLTGGQKDDGFYFGVNRWSSADRVDGQGGSLDQLGLQGNYSGANAVVFGANQITGIENIVLLSGADGRFGGAGTGFNYDLTLNDANVLVGTVFAVSAIMLTSIESLTLNASAERDVGIRVYSGAGADVLILGAQADIVFGGAGADRITGNGGADQLTGGAGNDSFVYLRASDSTAAAQDHILDFATGDSIDLAAVDSFIFIGGNAFTNSAGQLRATNTSGNDWLVEGDVDGDGTADLSILVTSDHALTIADFVGASSQAAIEPVGTLARVAIADLMKGSETPVFGAEGPGQTGRFGIELFAKEAMHGGVDAMDPLASHDFA